MGVVRGVAMDITLFMHLTKFKMLMFISAHMNRKYLNSPKTLENRIAGVAGHCNRTDLPKAIAASPQPQRGKNCAGVNYLCIS